MLDHSSNPNQSSLAFAPTNRNLDYWRKQTSPLFPDLAWNIPEQKSGSISIIGGNSQNFSQIIRTAEFLKQNFPFRHVATILPSALRDKLPALENIDFAPSTASGSFAKSPNLTANFNAGDLNLLAGDLSHNAETAIAITDAIKQSDKPLFITRDSIDLLAPSSSQIIAHPDLFLIGSMSQLQKIFRALYYPRMILLTQPLLPVLETFHKFTLTYNLTLLTFHQENIIVAHAGQVITTAIQNTSYTPLSLWSGQLAGKIAALNFFNPNHPLEATTAAILYD